MKTKRKSIRLLPHEDALLRIHYLAFGVPSDQFAKRPPQHLDSFVGGWNDLSERSDSAGEVLHYIKTLRKRGKWVKFSGDHQRMAEIPEDCLTDGEWQALREVYETLFGPDEIGSDNLAYDPLLATSVERDFALKTGRILSGQKLLALIMARRKRRDWIKVAKKDGPKPSLGFGDIDQIAM